MLIPRNPIPQGETVNVSDCVVLCVMAHTVADRDHLCCQVGKCLNSFSALACFRCKASAAS